MEESFNSNNDCHEELQGVDSENFIQLLDGRKLQCFPPKDIAPELLTKEPNSLDTTGEYLRLRKHPTPKLTEQDKKELVKLFADNAFLVIANRERILSDSRMFLAPVPVSNGLAYSGAFPEPSLGIYVEWWLNCPSSVLFDEADNLSVVWSLAGSPLSGSNQCATVNEDGAVEYRQLSCFRMLWPSFSDICLVTIAVWRCPPRGGACCRSCVRHIERIGRRIFPCGIFGRNGRCTWCRFEWGIAPRLPFETRRPAGGCAPLIAGDWLWCR